MATGYESGTVYIGVVGPENEAGICRDSIQNLQRRPGDGAPSFIRATKGFEARQAHFERWLETRHDYLLLLDHDMVFVADTLERLRSHGLPYVSGYYLRRSFAPLAPVWFRPFTGQWPFEPWSDDPERGRLHELGASGWGCLLVHRAVAEGVRPWLKGEPFVIEDDMDLWPYDLTRVRRAIRALRSGIDMMLDFPELPALHGMLQKTAVVLEQEIRPLRGVKDTVGSDIRFPFYARAAGFVLHGDPDVRPGHLLHYPLSPDDLSGQPPEVYAMLAESVGAGVEKERARVGEALLDLGVLS